MRLAGRAEGARLLITCFIHHWVPTIRACRSVTANFLVAFRTFYERHDDPPVLVCTVIHLRGQ